MSDERERWRWVPGYEGSYLVSDMGRVFSLPSKTTPGLILSTHKRKSGYVTVCLCKENRKKYYSVHRLVASAFIPNPMGKPEVNHINGYRHDNRSSNLEWVTRSENEKHSYHVLGRQPNRPWAGKPRRCARKFSDDQIRSIRKDTRPTSVLSAEYGVSKTTIKNIKRGKIYKEVI